MSRYPFIAATALVVALTVFLTWPQSLYLGTKVAAHNDPYFSMWRLAWIAHALKVDPHHLYDANVFYPEVRTLAYSDATLLEGALAAPLIWVGLSPVLVYNLMLLTGIAASGLAMFALVRHLTGNVGAALVSATLFTLVPYRIEHFMHLELQWMMWMPLAFWAVHRAVDELAWRLGALVGIFIWLQMLSCVYYGIFLGLSVGALGVLLIATRPGHRLKATGVLALGALVALPLAYLYARPYLQNARTLGDRDLSEILTYSAQRLSYLTTSSQNWLWGWTADRFYGNELRLFPGAIAVTLGVLGLAGKPRRFPLVYLGVCLLAVEMSLGFNGWLYPRVYEHVFALKGLRATARFSSIAFCALAVLAGFAIDRLQKRFRDPRPREWVAAVAILLLVLESGSAPMYLTTVPTRVPDVYRVVNGFEPSVLAEFPMAEPSWFPGFDPLYAFWSTVHWKPLVNGYSGYVSPRQVDTLQRMLSFPDDASIARLKELNVRYILVHQALYQPKEHTALLLKMSGREELIPQGKFKDWVGDTQLFELKR